MCVSFCSHCVLVFFNDAISSAKFNFKLRSYFRLHDSQVGVVDTKLKRNKIRM